MGDWDRVLMIHLEADPERARRDIPFPLDLHEGRAFVTLVAFTLRGLRPRFGGALASLLFRPIATHEFLNVRTYVNVDGEPGIHFLAEWLSNRLAVALGPSTFALPYRHGRIHYDHDPARGCLRGRVEDTRGRCELRYAATLAPDTAYGPCAAGTLDEWLMERYTAFNCVRNRRRFFRVWHRPWPQCPVEAVLRDCSLLVTHWPWMRDARVIGANYSPGVNRVWMGRPHRGVMKSG
jgi:uncharacterized protein YqjF (DUF2071 family)